MPGHPSVREARAKSFRACVLRVRNMTRADLGALCVPTPPARCTRRSGCVFACHCGRGRIDACAHCRDARRIRHVPGLMRWPSIHWILADAYANTGAVSQGSLSAIFAGLRVHLGNYIGEFLGEAMSLGLFLLASLSMMTRRDSLVGWDGQRHLCLAVSCRGVSRTYCPPCSVIADANNVLLPLCDGRSRNVARPARPKPARMTRRHDSPHRPCRHGLHA